MRPAEILKRNMPLLIFIAAFIFYGISAGLKITAQSHTPDYIYLAHSFLHGKTNLIELPADTFDLIFFKDKWYVIGGISPALLALPFVAFFGIQFSDVFFGVLIGALNAAMMYSLLSVFVEKISTRLWLIILFAAGTAHWALASVGSVWLNAQLTALLFMILFVRETLRGKAWLAGLWLGMAFLARPPIITAALFYLSYVVFQEREFRSVLRKLIPFGAALSGCAAAMLVYNYLRFGNPLEFGYGYLIGTKTLTDTYNLSGGFNIRYMPCNIYVSLFGTPNINLHPLPTVNEVCSYLNPIADTFGKASSFFNPLGMSMFIATPALFLIFRAKIKDKLVLSAWVGTLSVILPIWMYHATGWVQFGYRFITDFMVFLFVLLGCAVKRAGNLEKILISLSVGMGAVGLYLTYYAVFGLLWNEMFVEMARKIYHIVF
ncbi:MAG: hypothetical protein PHQ36_10105 [Anaerolineales bacterium]|nr:hypothetical protein [Anaerolineales bacterium]